MNHKTQACDVVREPRYQLENEQSVVIELKQTDGIDVETISGKLNDLSSTGAQFTTNVSVPMDQAAQVKFFVEELGLVLHVSARICWTRQFDDGAWASGCSLNPALSEDLFERLAICGEIDRRSQEREPVGLEISVLWGDLEESGHVVSLRDYSSGGFCIVSKNRGIIDQRVHVCIRNGPESLVVVARTLWQLNYEGEYLIGCSFLNGRDFSRLEQFIEVEATHAQ